MNDEKEQSFNEWLVINSQLGDVSAFNTLLVRWQPRLLAYATRRLGDRELAREAVQEALLSISRGIVKLRDPAAFPGWCFRVLERRCVDALRKKVAEQRKRDELAISAIITDSEDNVDRLDDALTVQSALAKLDPDLVVILKLFYQESFRIREIGRILAIPAGTVKSRLYYARKTLAAILENGND